MVGVVGSVAGSVSLTVGSVASVSVGVVLSVSSGAVVSDGAVKVSFLTVAK